MKKIKEIYSLDALKEINNSFKTEKNIEYLMKTYYLFSNRIEINKQDKDEFTNLLKTVNEKFERETREEYKIYILRNPKFVYLDEKRTTLDFLSKINEVVFKTLLLKDKSVFCKKEKKLLLQTETTHLCNYLFRTKDKVLSIQEIKMISYLLKQEEIKEFLNFVVKMDLKVKTSELSEDGLFVFNFLEQLDQLFILLKLKRNEIYLKIIETIHNEKKYFRVCFFKALPDILIEKIFNTLRDYNFTVLASLFELRPFLVKLCCKKMQEGNLLIPRKNFLECVLQNDKYFYSKMKYLKFLPETELISLCDKSDLFLEAYFMQKVGSFYEYCKILATKGEERILDLIKKHLDNENMLELIKYISYTIKLSGSLKEFILNSFGGRKEYFEFLLPFMSFDMIDRKLEGFYVPEKILNAFLRKYHKGDFLIELHKYSDSESVNLLLRETFDSSKFSVNDYIFLIKFLETAECSYKFMTIYTLLERKEFKNECVDFCNKITGTALDEYYVKCVMALDKPELFDETPLLDLKKAYSNNEELQNYIDKLSKKKRVTKHLRNLKKIINK